MLLEHERYYGLGMDALVSVCSWNTVAAAHAQKPHGRRVQEWTCHLKLGPLGKDGNDWDTHLGLRVVSGMRREHRI